MSQISSALSSAGVNPGTVLTSDVVTSALKDFPHLMEHVTEALDMHALQGLLNGDGEANIHDAQAEPFAPVADGAAGADQGGHWFTTVDAIGGAGSDIIQLEGESMVNLQSASAAAQLSGQEQMQRASGILESIKGMIQQQDDAVHHAIDSISVNVIDASPDAGAVADPGDSHLVAHVDHDSGYAAPAADHASAPVAHDDGAASDPSATTA